MDEHTTGVSDVDNSDLLAVVLTVVNESNSAWLNEVLVSLHMTKKDAVSFDSDARLAGDRYPRSLRSLEGALGSVIRAMGWQPQTYHFFFSINYIK